MLLDLEFTKTTLKDHPSTLLKKHRWRYSLPLHRLSLSSELRNRVKGSRVAVFGVIQIVQSPPTAKGVFFITLEDETGFLNLVLKPDVYQKFKTIIQTSWALLVKGQLQNADGYASLLVTEILEPNSQPKVIRSLVVERQHPTPEMEGRSRLNDFQNTSLPLLS